MDYTDHNKLIHDNIGITPAGVYCLHCKTHFEVDKWRRHFNQHHPNIIATFPKTMSNIINKLNFQIRQAVDSDNIVSYAFNSKLYNKLQCSSCKKIFRDNNHSQQHLNSHHNTCTSTNSLMVTTPCYKLKCGRFYPAPQQPQQQSMVSTMPTQPMPQQLTNQSQLIRALPSYAAAVLPTQSDINNNPALQYTQYFGSLPSNIMKQTTIVEAVLTQLISKDDTTKDWIKIFYKGIANNEYYVEQLKTQLLSDNLKPSIVLSSIGSPLTKVMDLYITLEDQTPKISNGLPADWKAKLVKFEIQKDDDAGIEGANTWAWRYRDNSTPQHSEMGHLLCYLSANNCPTLQPLLRFVSLPDYSHQQAAANGIVSTLLYQLAAETVTDGDHIPWMCRYAQFRCFNIERESNAPKLKASATCGKVFATILYILRQGVLACASRMMNTGHSDKAMDMIGAVQSSPVINFLSPWIAQCRAMTARQAKKETSTMASNGDVICNNATFRKSTYCQLIPLVRGAICTILGVMFEGDDWRHFLNKKNLIQVSNKARICMLFVPATDANATFKLLGQGWLVLW